MEIDEINAIEPHARILDAYFYNQMGLNSLDKIMDEIINDHHISIQEKFIYCCQWIKKNEDLLSYYNKMKEKNRDVNEIFQLLSGNESFKTDSIYKLTIFANKITKMAINLLKVNIITQINHIDDAQLLEIKLNELKGRSEPETKRLIKNLIKHVQIRKYELADNKNKLYDELRDLVQKNIVNKDSDINNDFYHKKNEIIIRDQREDSPQQEKKDVKDLQFDFSKDEKNESELSSSPSSDDDNNILSLNMHEKINIHNNLDNEDEYKSDDSSCFSVKNDQIYREQISSFNFNNNSSDDYAGNQSWSNKTLQIVVTAEGKKRKIRALKNMLDNIDESMPINDDIIACFFDAINPLSEVGRYLFTPLKKFLGISEPQPNLDDNDCLNEVISYFIILIKKIRDVNQAKKIYIRLFQDNKYLCQQSDTVWTQSEKNSKWMDALLDLTETQWINIESKLQLEQEMNLIIEKAEGDDEVISDKELRSIHNIRYAEIWKEKTKIIEDAVMKIWYPHLNEEKKVILREKDYSYLCAELSMNNKEKISYCCTLLQDSFEGKFDSYNSDHIFKYIYEKMYPGLEQEELITVFLNNLKTLRKKFEGNLEVGNLQHLNKIIGFFKTKRECLLLLDTEDRYPVVGIENCWAYFYQGIEQSLKLCLGVSSDKLNKLNEQLNLLTAKIARLSSLQSASAFGWETHLTEIKNIINATDYNPENVIFLQLLRKTKNLLEKIEKKENLSALRDLLYNEIFYIDMTTIQPAVNIIANVFNSNELENSNRFYKMTSASLSTTNREQLYRVNDDGQPQNHRWLVGIRRN